MRIPFHKRHSEFIKPIAEAVRQTPMVSTGDSLMVSLSGVQNGYQGSVCVSIASDSPDDFDSNWKASSHFPARIKAAATALRDVRSFGRYQITHSKGEVTIRRLED